MTKYLYKFPFLEVTLKFGQMCTECMLMIAIVQDTEKISDMLVTV